jgi:hypothetical protein
VLEQNCGQWPAERRRETRELDRRGISPPVRVLASLTNAGTGEGFTHPDHPALANQLSCAYAWATRLRSLASVMGEDSLPDVDRSFLAFGREFEQQLVNQQERRTLEQSETRLQQEEPHAGEAPVNPTPEARACALAYREWLELAIARVPCYLNLRRLAREHVRTERRARAIENVLLPEIEAALESDRRATREPGPGRDRATACAPQSVWQPLRERCAIENPHRVKCRRHAYSARELTDRALVSLQCVQKCQQVLFLCAGEFYTQNQIEELDGVLERE